MVPFIQTFHKYNDHVHCNNENYKHFLQQVDILISKNLVLPMLYLKHHVYKTSQIIMDKKLTKCMKI